ncbi:putative dipeptidyl-peptidase IV [Trichinella spiralis]|uniref:putative dipeptidyl-peptidase IV n=1 Tax=Trichinella spiralis TaxID=6334 RepID=UPI0001EFBEF8|nr:putative dipeptidyl-peptidase IV [Trichinella spiralis]
MVRCADGILMKVFSNSIQIRKTLSLRRWVIAHFWCFASTNTLQMLGGKCVKPRTSVGKFYSPTSASYQRASFQSSHVHTNTVGVQFTFGVCTILNHYSSFNNTAHYISVTMLAYLCYTRGPEATQ